MRLSQLSRKLRRLSKWQVIATMTLLLGGLGYMGLGSRLAGGQGSTDSPQSSNTGGLQLNRHYSDGDPWPFRLVAGGCASMVVAVGYGFRVMLQSRPDWRPPLPKKG